MQYLRKIIGLVAIGISLAMVAAACGSDDEGGDESDSSSAESDELSIRLAPASESLSFLPQLNALAQGYFDDEGLEVDYLPILQNASDAAQTVLSGAADISSTGSNAIFGTASAGRDAVSIAMLSTKPTMVMVLHNDVLEELEADGITVDSPIEDKVAALEGRTIAVLSAGSTVDIVMRRTLSEYGLNPDSDVTLQPLNDFSAQAAATRQGRVDGYLSPLPSAVLLVPEGLADVWINYAAGEVPIFASMPQTDLVTSRAYLEDHPEELRRYLRALWRSVEDIRTNPAEVLEVVKREFYPDMDDDVFQLAFDLTVPAVTEGLLATSQGFETLLEVVNTGRTEQIDVTFDDVYDMTLAEETQP